MNYIIGIDGGTTKIKAVLFDTTGHEIETVAAPSDILEDGGLRAPADGEGACDA